MNFEINANTIFDELVKQLSPMGYLVQHIANLRPEYFNKKSWQRFWYEKEEARFRGNIDHSFIAVYRVIKREKEYELYYFGTEAIKTYEVLLQNKIRIDVVITQDHGLGGLWTTFCKDSLLEEYSCKYKKMPKFLFVGENYQSWNDYEKVIDSFGKFGLHEEKRAFYKVKNVKL